MSAEFAEVTARNARKLAHIAGTDIATAEVKAVLLVSWIADPVMVILLFSFLSFFFFLDTKFKILFQ